MRTSSRSRSRSPQQRLQPCGTSRACLPPPRPPRRTTTFAKARAELNRELDGLTWATVERLTVLPSRATATGTQPDTFHGQARTADNRIAWFEKRGRATLGGIRVGGAALVADTPLGAQHPAAQPVQGGAIVGRLVPNTRADARIPWVLEGWALDAAPLRQLQRLVKHGTRAAGALSSITETEMRDLLQQSACTIAQLELVGSSRPRLNEASRARDDLWQLARIVLVGDTRTMAVRYAHESAAATPPVAIALRPPATASELEAVARLCLSKPAKTFVEAAAHALGDASIAQSFLDHIDVDATAAAASAAASAAAPAVSFGAVAGGAASGYGHPAAPRTIDATAAAARALFDEAVRAASQQPPPLPIPPPLPTQPLPSAPRSHGGGGAYSPSRPSCGGGSDYNPTSPRFRAASPAYEPPAGYLPRSPGTYKEAGVLSRAAKYHAEKDGGSPRDVALWKALRTGLTAAEGQSADATHQQFRAILEALALMLEVNRGIVQPHFEIRNLIVAAARRARSGPERADFLEK